MRNNLLTCLTLACLAIPSFPAWASLPDLPPAPVGQAVSELLMLDANQALAAERGKGTSFATSPTATFPGVPVPDSANQAVPPDQAANTASKPTPRAAPQLTSIYGVGNRLHAQVLIDGQPTLYATGRSRSLAGADTWQLKRIAPPCVDLQSAAHGAMRLCASRFGISQ